MSLPGSGSCFWLVVLGGIKIYGSFENEALENKDQSTNHPNLENEAPIENEALKNEAP